MVISFDRKRGFIRVSTHQWIKDVGGEDEFVELEDVMLPVRKTKHSAGYDIFSTVDFKLEPNEEILMPLGWKVYMMFDEVFTVFPRSGLGFKYYTRLANTTGIIDSDYFNNEDNEGHCFLKLRNEGNKTLTVKRGDGVAQGIFMKYYLADGDDFDNGNIRKGGRGSTDKK